MDDIGSFQAILRTLDYGRPSDLLRHRPKGGKTHELTSSASSLRQRSAALKLDWAKVTTSLGLRGQTVASLQAFKARNDNAKRKVQQLSELPTEVNFAEYRTLLKNQAVVDEIEKRFKAFRPQSYDVNRQIKAIETFQAEAVKNAEATKEKVDLELQDLNKTLKNIEEARSFEELTVVRIRRRGQRQLLYEERRTLLTQDDRTMLLLPSLPSTRRPPSWFPRVAGLCRATRYTLSTKHKRERRLTAITGKIRRSLRAIDDMTVTFPLCTLAL